MLGESGTAAVIYLENASQRLLASVGDGTRWRHAYTLTRKAVTNWTWDSALYAGITSTNEVVVVWDKGGSVAGKPVTSVMSSVRSPGAAWRRAQRLPGLPTHVEIAPTGFNDGRRLMVDNAGRLVFNWRPNGRTLQSFGSTYTAG